MCGISGLIDFNGYSSDLILKNMTDALIHRGPDDSGYFFENFGKVQVGLGQRRLSILDLSKLGRQPMTFENLTISYNGEIYNFKEIRSSLQSIGYKFISETDTEVILKAFHHWGIQSVNKFNGMFAIAIYDDKNKKFFLIRDRAGVKPCYYSFQNNLFLFSSELKSFHHHKSYIKKINNNSLALFLQYGYVPEPYTIFENTHKLKAGHYLEFDLNSKKCINNRYWDLIKIYNKPKLKIDSNEVIEETESLLKDSFNYRMVSDVPVGIFLSGGYDSSIVTAILQNSMSSKLNTFTIGFSEDGFNEAPYAKDVANYLGTNHHEYYCSEKNALDLIPELGEIYDEPFGDVSSIPTILLSKFCRKHVTVSLSADGGDEIFSGYNKYQYSQDYLKKLKIFPQLFKNNLSVFLKLIDSKNIPFTSNIFNFENKYEKFVNIIKSKNSSELFKYISQYYTSNQLNLLIKNPFSNVNTNFDMYLNDYNDDLNNMLALDYKSYLVDDVLVKVDRATMSVGLEGREPLLDYRIIEFMAQLPSEFKMQNNNKKWILKEITHKYLPKKLMDRPKMGFGIPINKWMKSELKDLINHYLDENRLEREGVFNVKEVIRLKNNFFNTNSINPRKVWFILIFELWYEKWMNS